MEMEMEMERARDRGRGRGGVSKANAEAEAEAEAEVQAQAQVQAQARAEGPTHLVRVAGQNGHRLAKTRRHKVARGRDVTLLGRERHDLTGDLDASLVCVLDALVGALLQAAFEVFVADPLDGALDTAHVRRDDSLIEARQSLLLVDELDELRVARKLHLAHALVGQDLKASLDHPPGVHNRVRRYACTKGREEVVDGRVAEARAKGILCFAVGPEVNAAGGNDAN